MITSVSKGYEEQYRELFAVATDSLRGYDRVQTFDKNRFEAGFDEITNTSVYYTKNAEDRFSPIVFNGADAGMAFALISDKLADGEIIYIDNNKGNKLPEGTSITSLEEYFHWLPDLIENKNGAKEHSVFIKLPLDEPHFEINANTRAITVPANFKKNGIAVQGDDLAETVYFMIDRFVDYVDLNNTEIYIEWETPKDKEGKVTKHFSRNYGKIIDDKYHPGKLIFGWAISDVLTRAPGVLKFAVRFILRETDEPTSKIIYSFNTLTAQASVQATLNADLANVKPEDIEDSTKELLQRIDYGVIVGNIQAAKPTFILKLDTDPNNKSGLTDYNAEKGYDCEDLGEDNMEGLVLKEKLYAVATSPDTGAISYEWYMREDEDSDWSPYGSNGLEWVQIDDEIIDAWGRVLPTGRIFYSSQSADSKYNDGAEVPENNLVYERRAVAEVQSAGQYKVIARNRTSNSINRIESSVVEYKRPEKVVFKNPFELKEGYIIGESEELKVEEIETAIGNLIYQWYRADSKDGDFEPIGETEGVYIPVEKGYYKIGVIRKRNNVRAEESMSGAYRVTKNLTEPPKFDDSGVELELTPSEAQANKLTLKWEPMVDIDKYIIDWYKKGESEDSDTILKSYDLTDGSATFHSEFCPLDPNEEGTYYAKITAIRNGQRIESENSRDHVYIISVNN